MLRISSSERISEIRSYILFDYVSLHIFKNLCIRFVIVIQYEKSFLYLGYVFFSDWFLMILFGYIFIHLCVSGLSCRKYDSYHWLILMSVLLRSHWTHPAFLNISSFSCNIYIYYELNDFLFLCFGVLCFDGFIIPLLFRFVNTFFDIF